MILLVNGINYTDMLNWWVRESWTAKQNFIFGINKFKSAFQLVFYYLSTWNVKPNYLS